MNSTQSAATSRGRCGDCMTILSRPAGCGSDRTKVRRLQRRFKQCRMQPDGQQIWRPCIGRPRSGHGGHCPQEWSVWYRQAEQILHGAMDVLRFMSRRRRIDWSHWGPPSPASMRPVRTYEDVELTPADATTASMRPPPGLEVGREDDGRSRTATGKVLRRGPAEITELGGDTPLPGAMVEITTPVPTGEAGDWTHAEQQQQ